MMDIMPILDALMFRAYPNDHDGSIDEPAELV